MLRAKELTLSHENLRDARKYRKGAWQRASNILSCMTMMSGTTGTTYLVIDSVGKAKKAFASARQPYTEADVLRVELPNTPGRSRGSPVSSPKKTSTSLSAIRRVPKARGR